MFKKSIIYLLGSAAAALISFIVIPIYSKFMTPSEFGYLSMIQITITFSTIILSFGLGTAYIVKYYKVDDKERKNLTTSILVSYLLLTIFCLFFAPLYKLFISVFGVKFELYDYVILVLVSGFSMVLDFYLALLRIQHKAFLYILFAILRSSLIAGFTLLFLLFFKLSYWSFLYANAIVLCILSFSGTIFHKKLLIKPSYKTTIKIIKSLGRISWPILPTQITLFIITSSNRYFLNSLVDANAVGIYSIGYRFGTLIQSFAVVPFFSAFSPKVYEAFTKNLDKFKNMQINFFTFFLSIILILLIMVSVFSRELFVTIFDSRYHQAYLLIWIVILGVVFYSAASFFDSVLAMKEKFKYSMYNSFIGAFLSIFLNFYLIKSFSFYGAAVAFTLCNLFMMIFSYLSNQYIMKLNYDITKLLTSLAISIIIIISNYFNISHNIFLNIFIKVIFSALGIYIIVRSMYKNIKYIRL